MKNSEYIDKFGFFVGNQHVNIIEKIQYLFDTINDVFQKRKFIEQIR
jgi:hypothetical protein